MDLLEAVCCNKRQSRYVPRKPRKRNLIPPDPRFSVPKTFSSPRSTLPYDYAMLRELAAKIYVHFAQLHELISRDRPKSAPYLRLKSSKRTSKCQRIVFYSTRKTQKVDRIGAPGPFDNSVANHQKN